jgi:hypothetical protein
MEKTKAIKERAQVKHRGNQRAATVHAKLVRHGRKRNFVYSRPHLVNRIG